MAWNSARLSRPAPSAQHQESGDAPPIGKRRRNQREVEESETGEAAGENQQEGDAAAQHDGPGEARGGHNSNGEAEEVVADGDEIRRVAMIAPGGQNGAEQRQQKSGDEEAGQGAAASGRTGICQWCACEVHCLRLYYSRALGQGISGRSASARLWESVESRSRKRDDWRACLVFSIKLRMARGVHLQYVRFWFRGLSALVSCLPRAICHPRYGHHLPGSGDFFCLW